MAVKPPGERLAKWNRRYDADHVKKIIDNEKASVFYAHAQHKFQMLADMEAAVKMVLNSEGISVAQTASYLAFAREVWKKEQTYSGETLAIEAATLIGKWVARGLSQSVLEALRSQVFNVSAPTP